MSMASTSAVVLAAGLVLAASPTWARNRTHHHHAAQLHAPLYGGSYGSNGDDGDIIARRTAEAYREPGVTQELAPDAKQTATGGPSGGVPGFSGH